MDILMEIIYEPRKNMGLNGFILPTNKCDYTEIIEITKKMSMKWEKPFREVFPGPPFRWLSSSSSKELKRLVTPLCLDGWILVPHSWFSWFII